MVGAVLRWHGLPTFEPALLDRILRVRALVDHAADDLTAALAHIEAITQDSPKLAQGKSKGEKPVLAFSGNEHKFRNEQKPSVTSKKNSIQKSVSVDGTGGWINIQPKQLLGH